MIKKLLTVLAFASLGSIAWGGVHVQQNDSSVTIGSVTMTTGGITFPDASVQTTAATGGGGGGSSSLEVFVGAARSSPTASISANSSQFRGTVVGSTFTFTLQSSSVTLQGPLPTSLGTVTTGVWNGTRLTSTYVPTDVAYTDVANTFTSSQTATAGGGLFTTYGTSVGSVTLRNVASGTQCLHADGSGNVTGTGADCGSGSGSGGYAVEPATVTFNLAKGVIGSTMNFTAFNATTTSATVTGAGGLNTTYNASLGSATVRNLSASLPVQTDGSSNLTSAAIDLSGSQATGILAAGRFPALTGDVRTSAGALATTAAALQPNITTFSSSITVTGVGGIAIGSPTAANETGGNSRYRLAMQGVIHTESNNLDANQSTGLEIVSVSSSGNAFINLWRSSGTIASPLATQSGMLMSRIGGGGYGATGWIPSTTGRMDVIADETFTDATAATSLNFFTTPTGSTTTVSRLNISSNGAVTIKSSNTITGSGGENVTYGAIVGSMTVSNLASGQCVQTTAGGLLTVTGSGCASGSSGASALAVYTGTSGLAATQVSSPTAIINLDRSQFGASLTGSATAFITIAYSTSNVTTNYTATSTNTLVSGDATGGAITITLPTAVGITGKVYHVKMVSASSGTNTVTVATTSAQTIDVATTQVMTLQYTNLEVISNGSNWSIL